jgi:arylsulfatase A-like enzyme
VNHSLNAKAGADQGFDWYRDSQPFSLMTDQRIDAADLVHKTLDRVAARTDAERARPLYLQLAFVDSHKPLKIPPAEFEHFKGDGAEIGPYRASLHRLDDALRRLVEGLEGQGVTAADTIFVVVGDHGEGLEMPLHHRKQHGFVLYESSVRIPWIFWGKGIPKGKEVGGLASAIDLAPTLVSLAGVSGQAGYDGLDLSEAVRTGRPTGRDRAFADTLYDGVHRASLWTSDRQCQKDYGSTKVMEDDTFESACYDRVADPQFTKPIQDDALAAELDAQHAELVETAKATLAAASGDDE